MELQNSGYPLLKVNSKCVDLDAPDIFKQSDVEHTGTLSQSSLWENTSVLAKQMTGNAD